MNLGKLGGESGKTDTSTAAIAAGGAGQTVAPTTNTANATQTDGPTTTDLDRLTQSQAGDNEPTGLTGKNAEQSADATDSAVREAGLDQVAASEAQARAEELVRQQLARQESGDPMLDAGGNFISQTGAELSTDSSDDVYTSHPTKNLKLGRFQFENSTLTLSGDDKAEFAKLLDGQPPFVKFGVKKIDSGAAAKLAQQFLDQNKMTRGIDTAGNGVTRTQGSAI